MALPEINFAFIRAHDGSRNAGFEELCCQLASLELRATDDQFFRKGRGGDAGVECFVRSAGSAEAGWQAKYVLTWSQSLVRQLDASIQTALIKHPKLTKYIVCLPFDLADPRAGSHKTPLEQWEARRNKWIKTAKSKRRKLHIELWGKHELTERLTRDDAAYAGRLMYWFDQTSFTPDWFTHQFEKARAALGSRYTPETNVELPIRRDFLGFTRDHSLNVGIHNFSVKIQEQAHTAVEAVRRASTKRNSQAKAIENELDDFVSSLSGLPVPPEKSFPIPMWLQGADKIRKNVQDSLELIYGLPPKKHSNNYGTEPIGWAQHCLLGISDTLHDLVANLDSEQWKLANHRAVLLYGAAGTGKSHLLADVVEHHIACGFPGVLALGSNFVDGEPWRQILTQLDLPATLQTKQFLAAMDSAAQAAGVRAIICIDAINERNGIDVWPAPGFEDTKLGVFMEPEVDHGTTEVYARVQA